MRRSFDKTLLVYKLNFVVLRRLKKNWIWKSEPLTSVRFALESMTVTKPNYIRCLFRICEKGFSVSVHQTHLLKNILPISKLIRVTFWFDGKFYSRTCSGVDLLSGVHTKRCQPLHLLSRTITEVNDWMQHTLAKSWDTSGLHLRRANQVNDWVRIPLGWTIER